MDGSKIHEDVNDDRVFCGHVEFPDLNCRKNVTSQGLFELLKFSILAFLINGADRVFKDRKLLKTTSLVIDRRKGSASCDRGFLCQNGEKWKCNSETCQGSGEGTSGKQRKKINYTMLENEKVGVESDYPLLQPREDRFDGTCQWNKEYVDVSEVVKSPSGGYMHKLMHYD
ncbi:hypothetical protein L1049_000280 [Liquidambar formosana]|uniref:Uncharacterized protein n=1 Tax=Liquidambar formosana TaxID=63359 RepID=A0AAP0R2J4_LIQFO